MDKKSLGKKKTLYIVGSAKGVKRFYIVNRIYELKAGKIIHTGNLINRIIKRLGFKEMDKISIYDYYRYIEPVFVDTIITHLNYTDVILDTHYHYLLPGISIKELLKFKEVVARAKLILVEETKDNIIASNEGDWYEDIKNVEEDILLNKYYFESYANIFKKFCSCHSIELNKDNIKEVNKIVGD